MALAKRKWIILAVCAVLLVVGFFLVQHLLDPDTYRPRIQSALSDALGRRVSLGRLDASLLSGSLVAEGLTIADDPSFSTEPFLSAKALRIGVEMGPLLFQRDLRITGFTVEQPSIRLLRAENGVWNYSNIGGAGQRKPAAPQTTNPIPNLTVARMDIKDGVVTVGTLPLSTKARAYNDLNVSVQKFSMVNSFPFTIQGKLPAGGSLELSGTAGPINPHDASLTPLKAKIALKHADLLGAGLVEPGQGISGIADLDAQVDSNGQTAHVEGKLQASQLKLAKNGTPSAKPVDAKFVVDQQLQDLSGKIQSLDLQVGKAALAAQGSYQTRGNITTTNLNVNGQNMPVDELVAFLPSLGIQLPSGSRLQGGTLFLKLGISGPVTAPVIAGPVRVVNTQLAGFDLGQKLASIQSLTGAKTGSNTTIQVLSTDLRYGPDGTHTDNLAAVIAGMGAASGSGSISPGGALNYHLIVKLSSTGLGGLATQAMSLIPGAFGSMVGQTTKDGIPITIGGTTANPSFALDMSSLASRTSQQQKTGTRNSLTDALSGLFRKR